MLLLLELSRFFHYQKCCQNDSYFHIGGDEVNDKCWGSNTTEMYIEWIYSISRGKILGNLGNLPVLILNTEGRKTGRIIKTVLVYYSDQGKFFIIASFGGNPNNPSWFLNIKKNPNVSFQIKNEEFNCFARVLSKEEKDLIWPKIINFYSGYA